MAHVGIDLGTTFTLASYVNAQGVLTLCPDIDNPRDFRTPSVVHVGPTGVLVGRTVEDSLDTQPQLPVCRFAKLAMGTSEAVFRDHRDRNWPAEAISALILRKVKRDLEAHSNEAIDSAVITVPAQFGDAQRRATRLAAAMAGLPNPRIVDEPVAAASYYGFADANREQTIFVYDLGGGTFDATLLHVSPDGLYALATEGQNDLGGKWFDDALIEMIVEEVRDSHGLDVRQEPGAMVQLRRAAEEIKTELSGAKVDRVERTLMLGAITQDIALTRGQYERLIAAPLKETLAVCERCLEGAALGWDAIDTVLLTGGSSLLGAVRQMVRAASGLGDDRIIRKQPYEAVAHGAALIGHGANAQGADANGAVAPLVQQIASNDLGIRIIDPQTQQPGIQVLIARNSPLPASHSATFYTRRDDQTRLVLELVQRKSREGPGGSLGHFAFGPILTPRKNYPVEVTLAYEVEGFVKVTARDPQTGQAMDQMMEDRRESGAAALTAFRDVVATVRINE